MKKRVTPAVRAILTGALVAVLVLAVAAGGAWWYLRSTGALIEMERPATIVVVFSGPGDDGATIAQVVVQGGADASGMRSIPPETSVTVPGTTYGTVRDAYSFGGAKAVAAAVGGSDRSVGWIDVPASSWAQVIDAAGGLRVTLPSEVDVYDGASLLSFPAGDVTVGGGRLPALMNGVAFLPSDGRARVRDAVAPACVRALARAGIVAPTGVKTNLSPDAYALWARDAR